MRSTEVVLGRSRSCWAMLGRNSSSDVALHLVGSPLLSRAAKFGEIFERGAQVRALRAAQATTCAYQTLYIYTGALTGACHCRSVSIDTKVLPLYMRSNE